MEPRIKIYCSEAFPNPNASALVPASRYTFSLSSLIIALISRDRDPRLAQGQQSAPSRSQAACAQIPKFIRTRQGTRSKFSNGKLPRGKPTGSKQCLGCSLQLQHHGLSFSLRVLGYPNTWRLGVSCMGYYLLMGKWWLSFPYSTVDSPLTFGVVGRTIGSSFWFHAHMYILPTTPFF